jgi:glycosyltransferase involved in cell wall biosynthesis
MFARGRAVIVPSLAESLPYIVLEAAAAGLPVLSTKVGGIDEIFGPTAGSLLPAGDADALARAMSRVLTDPSSAASEARERLAHVRAGFSVDAMTDGIEGIYRKALAARR